MDNNPSESLNNIKSTQYMEIVPKYKEDFIAELNLNEKSKEKLLDENRLLQ